MTYYISKIIVKNYSNTDVILTKRLYKESSLKCLYYKILLSLMKLLRLINVYIILVLYNPLRKFSDRNN